MTQSTAIPNSLSLPEFQSFLSNTLGIAEVAVTPDAHFLSDLGIDSLKLVELMLQLELQLGITIPSEAAWEMQTVNDAYSYYLSQSQGEGQPPPLR